MAANDGVTVRLDENRRRRIEKAAGILHESTGDFLSHAADRRARAVLLDWAVRRYQAGEATFGELAEETGLAIEEIMTAMGSEGRDEALDRFLDRIKALARARGNSALLDLAEQAVAAVRAESS
jgi:hypothetical protein